MTNPKGLRRGTRYMFARKYKRNGVEPLTTFLRRFKVGDIVDVKGNGCFQKGMPFKHYHGKTGRIYSVTKHAVGVLINKRVRQRIMEKRITVRVEHIRPSKCRQDFLDRVKANDLKKKEARANNTKVHLKRQATQPREAHVVNFGKNEPVWLAPVRWEEIA